ncbi:hypothetical protein [Kordiimonas aquimaris]|uniref:hypothetical protein n=1 Tax=Kordiimonas aquimaris TaxID=707591 RepID=UPI0021D0BB1B|nr:hypothetical protein [Kordiimonas aquimaris]
MTTMVRELNMKELAFVSGAGEIEEITVHGDRPSSDSGGGFFSVFTPTNIGGALGGLLGGALCGAGCAAVGGLVGAGAGAELEEQLDATEAQRQLDAANEAFDRELEDGW